MAMAAGMEELQNLESAGFTSVEISQWQVDTRGSLKDAGFSEQEVNGYFGERTPDLSKFEGAFKEKVSAKRSSENGSGPDRPQSGLGSEVPSVPVEERQAENFIQAIEAGFDMSVSGLLLGKPDVVLPENAPMFHRIASQVGTLAGDVPAMIAGAMAGGAAGTAVAPGPGTVIGAGAGAFAMPEGMRTALMEQYEKGDVKSFSDFWERTSAIAINSLKGGVIGGATAGVGGAVAKVAGAVAAPAIAKTAAMLTSEVATMTTVGAALEGHVPEPQDFLDAAILVGGLRGSISAATKIRKMYGKTGALPHEVAEQVQKDSHLKQQILAENVEVPVSGELGIKAEKLTPPEKFETVKPLKEPNPDLSLEVNTILGKVGEKGDRPKKALTFNEVYTNLVDKLDPINVVTKVLSENRVNLPAEANPYLLSRAAVDHKAKSKHFFENGTLDFKTLDINGPSLTKILKSVENPEILDAYLISRRAIEKNTLGKKTGFDIVAAEKVIKENKVKYDAAAKQVTEFSNNALQYAADAGILSKEQLANIKEANKDYVPFKRIIEDSDVPGTKRGGGKAGSLKEFKGSDREIQSPVTSIVENTIELIKMAEVNRPKLALVKLAESTEGQTLIVKVRTPVQEVIVKKEDVAKQLGISVEAAEAVSTFKAISKDLAPNQFAVFRDGKRQVYETTPELAAAISKLGGDSASTNILFKLASGITTVKKFGITFTPDFILRNLFRDVLTASAFTKGKPLTPLDIVGAAGDIWKKNDTYFEWLKSGGANGAFLEMSDRYVKTNIQGLQRETNFLNSARNLVQKPVDAMRVAAELSEQSVRVAEFKKVRKAGGTLLEAGISSREITIDFQRVGAKISALNSITAFMNVSIQGLDRTVRAVKENPAGVATKSLAYITTPSVLLWWANKDDPRYQEIPRWEKDLFWVIPTDNWKEATPEEAEGLPEYLVRKSGDKTEINKGTIYRLPKPQELGIVFGSLPERVLEAFFTENPDSFKDFNDTMVSLVTPSFVPDAVAPAIEQYFNKSFFTGRDIIPQHLRDILPEYQFVEYTSETAKALGKLVATVDQTSDFASPMVLQNYIRSWGGSLGQYAVQLADKALEATGVAEDRVSPTSTLSDIPFVKAFVVRFPQSGSNSVQDFFDNFGDNKKVIDTIRHLAKEGDFDNLEKELTLQRNQEKLVNLDGIKEALTTQSKFIRLVHKNPELLPDEKRQMIDGMYLMMTETAKQGNILMREVKEALGDKDGIRNDNQ